MFSGCIENIKKNEKNKKLVAALSFSISKKKTKRGNVGMMNLYGSALLKMYVEFEPSAKAVTKLRKNVSRKPQGELANRFEKKIKTFGSLNIGYFWQTNLYTIS